MKSISNEEMKAIEGGAVNWGVMAGLSAFASFLIGIVDGYINPRRCNS